MPSYKEKIEKLSLPMIPLRGIVAFPSAPLDFELERDISKKACSAAVAADRTVFLLTQKEMNAENPERDDLYTTGCVAKIKQAVRNPDTEMIHVSVEGLCRADLTALRMTEDGYMFADVLAQTITGDFSTTDYKTEATINETISSLEKIIRFIPNISPEFMSTAASINNPGLLSDFIAVNIFLRYQDKQSVLEIYDPLKRCEKAMVLMESEAKLMQTELGIHRKVKEAMDNNQKEFYLREQLKAIENELGINDDVDELEQKIKGRNLPKDVSDRVEKEMGKLAKAAPSSPDAAVIRNYIEELLDIPWETRTEDRLDIEHARKILDRDHDGLEKVKERILEYLAVKQFNPALKNQIICLVGPPGVGKTSLAASIATAMNRKYVRVSLGGVRDEADIRGHRKTYVASMPGRIVEALKQCGSMNPVMLLDEVDKLCSDMHGDPSSALLEVLDGEQNKAFRDHFIELPVDLSDCFFIATANTLDTVPRPLIDRMEIIELHTYTPTEKLAIAKNHLIPKQLKRHGLNKRLIRIPDETITDIIAGWTRESGVRNLEREISSLCRKGAKILVENPEQKSVKILPANLEALLGPRRFIDDEKQNNDLVGVTNGLAYTEVGGDMLKVEAAVVEGNGKIELTGTLGDVMKESAHIAVTYIRAHCGEFGIAPDFYKTKDIHIHIPEGAVPKDGPSAGVTLTTTLVSALSGIPVRHDIAMTGEITLTGRVIPIGGLREKSTAAYSMGLRTLLIPRGNMRDIAELDKVVAEEVTFIPCDTLDDVLKNALVMPQTKDTEKLPVVEPVSDDSANNTAGDGSIQPNKQSERLYTL